MVKQRVHIQFIVKKGKVGTPAKYPTPVKCCSPKRELVSLRLPFPPSLSEIRTLLFYLQSLMYYCTYSANNYNTY